MGQVDKLNKIAEEHSYAEGFNGQLTAYRQRAIEGFITEVDAGENCLEVGAGEGVNVEFLNQYFDRVVALEPAANYYEKLQGRNAYGVECVNKTFEAFRTEEKFSAIFMLGVLEHVRRPLGVLHKAKKMLRKAGKIYITVPNAESLHRQLGKELGCIKNVKELSQLDHRVGHYRYYDADALREDVFAAKLRVDTLGGIVLKPYPNNQMAMLPTAILDELYALGIMATDYCAELLLVASAERAG